MRKLLILAALFAAALSTPAFAAGTIPGISMTPQGGTSSAFSVSQPTILATIYLKL